jgi:hypothetical protein
MKVNAEGNLDRSCSEFTGAEEETGSNIDGGRCRKTSRHRQEYHLRYMQTDAEK